MADDIENLLKNFAGETAENYFEVEDIPEYLEPSRAENPPSRVAKELHLQAEKQAPIIAAPEQIAAVSVAANQPEVVGNIGDCGGRVFHETGSGHHTSVRSLLEELVRSRKEHCAAASSTENRTAAKVIAVVSMNGGVGKSTLSAALVGAVNGGGRRIAIDLDPQDTLRHHLGVDTTLDGDSGGLAAANWTTGLLKGHAGTQVLPYGAAGVMRQRAFKHLLDEEPKWLLKKLADMRLGSGDVVVLDTPPGCTPYLDQALSVADQVVTVVTPDAASLMVLDQAEQWFEHILGEQALTRCVYVVNRFDATRAFHQDMLDILRRHLGERLLGVVPFDEKVAQALAFGGYPLLNANTSSRAAMDDIAQVLHSRLNVSVTHGQGS